MWKNRFEFDNRSPSPSSSSGGRYSPYSEKQSDPLKSRDRAIIRSSVGDAKVGVLRYLGQVEFAEGDYAGVELLYPQGKNDGTINGIEYFRCKHPYGIFVPWYKVDVSPINKMAIKGTGCTDCDDRCEVHDKVLWNSLAVSGHKVTGVRNPDLYKELK